MKIKKNESPQLYTVVDATNKPLLHMPFASITRQKLYFRMALVAYFTKDNRLIVKKRNCQILPNQDLWDVFSTPVQALCATEDAARGMLPSRDFPLPETLVPVTKQPVLHDNAFTMLFKATLPPVAHTTQLAAQQPILLLDKDEVEGLTTATPELFTPELLWAVQHGIFSNKTNKS